MKPVSPYVGPRTFTEREQNLFFGRDREVEDLIHLLLSERIVLLHSPSGAGKSSLLHAGLIPKLKELDFETKGPLRVNDLANFPWEEQLSKDPHGEVLIFDQFEEAVTVDPFNVETKKRFFQQLGQALRNRKRWAVFAVREDYLAALDPYLNFIPTRLSNTFRLNLLGEKGAKDAICLPAQNAGIPFTKEASDALFDDLRTVEVQMLDGSKDFAKGDVVEPVQLQVVCDRIWRDLPEDAREIGWENACYGAAVTEKIQVRNDASKKDSFQEVNRALADFYSDAVKSVANALAASNQKITERDLRDWFEQRLITAQGIRTQVLRSEGLGDQVAELLINAHILRSEVRSNRVFVELAHDRLIQPMLASNKEWREANLSPFQQEAEKWNENNQRSPDRLLRGQSLQQAEAWAKSNVLTTTELEFLKASRRARRALWLGRAVTAVMAILLVTAAAYAWEFYKEKKRYLNALTAGRNTAHDVVFKIDADLAKVPKTTAIQKELLEKAMELNKTLSGEGAQIPANGQHFDSDYEAQITDAWGEALKGKVAELDEDREEARTCYQAEKAIALKLVHNYGDDPEAMHLVWLSNVALGDLDHKEGDYAHSLQDEDTASAKYNEATAFYQEALPTALKVVNGDPKNRLLRFDLLLLYKDLGDEVLDDSESHKFYTQALDQASKLAQEAPSDNAAQEFLWQSLIDLGDWNKNAGEASDKNHDEGKANASWKEASNLYQQALPVAQKLDQTTPNEGDTESRARHRQHQHMIWATYMALGDAEPDIHSKTDWYEKALTLAEEMKKEDDDLALGHFMVQRFVSTHKASQAKTDLYQARQALDKLKGGVAK